MKKLLVIILIFVVILLVAKTLLNNQSTTPSSKISPTSTTGAQSDQSSCNPEQLRVTMQLEPAAGNIYGSITLTNTSQKACDIVIGQKIQANVPPTIKNLTIAYLGSEDKETVTLTPGQSIYSQLHYPNGPQCSSGIVSTPVILTYPLANNQTLTLTDKNNSQVKVATCQNPVDMTTLDLWYFSTKPLVR